MERLRADREALFGDPDNHEWFEVTIVRALVRLGRLEEALIEAKASTARDGNPYLEAVVHAVAGRPEELLTVLAVTDGLDCDAGDYHEDYDLGPALRGPALAKVLEKYPRPEVDDDR